MEKVERTAGYCPGGHCIREGNGKNNTCSQRRINKIIAQAPEHLLYDNNGKKCAYYYHIKGKRRGKIKGKKDTGYNSGKIGYRIIPFHDSSGYIFENEAGKHRNKDHDHGPQTENNS